MAEQEVESVLREIREQVRAGQARASLDAQRTTEDGAGDSLYESSGERSSVAAGARARIEAHLATTARAWDRLPPVVTNRSGWAARLELWLKRHLKRATRWYAWEQVNFNASVHHALHDTLEALTAYERHLEKLRAEMRAEAEARRAELEAQGDELRARLSATEARFAADNEQLRASLASGVEQLRGEQRAHVEGLRNELREELRERDEHLRDEQRVCFKQLSLETGEAAVMQDRARRDIESRLEKLESLKAATSDER
ncbi:MAG: hypothetical protein LC754_11050 [Acidobacteria bacterium]|nr:hypothetical protein [Acidobacteriota bacterium]